MNQDKRRVLLGHIAGAHGIRGAVLIKSYAEDPAVIDAYGALQSEAGDRTFLLEVQSITPKGVIARVSGVEDRKGAEALKGVALYVDRAQLPDLEDGGYYHVDLIGLAAVAPDGAALGQVVDVHNYGAGDILEVKFSGKKRTELLPITDAVVPEIDVAGGRVVIAMPGSVEVRDEDAPKSDDDPGTA